MLLVHTLTIDKQSNKTNTPTRFSFLLCILKVKKLSHKRPVKPLKYDYLQCTPKAATLINQSIKLNVKQKVEQFSLVHELIWSHIIGLHWLNLLEL